MPPHQYDKTLPHRICQLILFNVCKLLQRQLKVSKNGFQDNKKTIHQPVKRYITNIMDTSVDWPQKNVHLHKYTSHHHYNNEILV